VCRLLLQERAASLVYNVATASRGPGGPPPKPLVLVGILRLLKDIKWSTAFVSAPHLGLLDICGEAAAEGRLGSKSTTTDMYNSIILPILQSCGKLQCVACTSRSAPTTRHTSACL
jgi:hypothetical protein